MLIIFWCSVGLILYTYVMYPLILLIWASLRTAKQSPEGNQELPTVSVIVAMYNEESSIEERVRNLKNISYPKDKIEFLFGSDGSTDKTNEIFAKSKAQNFRLMVFSKRRGKAAVLNDLVKETKGEVIVFSDANTFYVADTLQRLVGHFSDPGIGGVCGELLLQSEGRTVGGFGEKYYWKYENFLKNIESKVHSAVGATGAVYAIRKTLFRPLPTSIPVTDDFLNAMAVLEQGFRVTYDSEAVAYEKPADSISGEFRRKTRIGTANFNGISQFLSLLNPTRGYVAFALWSHKIIRWIVPFLLIIIISTSIALGLNSKAFQMFVLLETMLLAIALLGLFFDRLNVRIGILGLPYYFFAMNSALFVGFMKFALRRKNPTWEVVR